MIIHILGGGPVELLPRLEDYHEEEVVWVGVDRGVQTLMEKGIKPCVAFGDFDSITTDELSIIKKTIPEIKQFKPEKDETDMELAVSWAIEQNPIVIRMFGSTGGRLDHMFGNVQLLIKSIIHKPHIQVEMIDNKNIVYLKNPGTYSINKIKEKKYISFVPVSPEIKGLTLNGFKYPLTDCHICLGSTLCISNELINGCGTFSFSKGILMIIRSTD